MPTEHSIEIQIADIKTFSQENRVAVLKRRGCVDGRYKPDQEVGKIALPGADFNIVEALLHFRAVGKIHITPEEIADRIYWAARRIDGTFSMHTHCGHIDRALIPGNQAFYRALPEEVERAYKFLNESGRGVNLVPLEGEHKEEAVLALVGTTHTVKSQDNKNMFFVYNKVLADQYIDQVIANAGIIGISQTEARIASNRQMDATLRLLAAGLNIFLVNVDQKDNIIVQPFGKVPNKKLTKS